MGFDPQWTRYVGEGLSPAQAQIVLIKMCMKFKRV